ncbi:MAG: DUF1624 domain-containing protein [Chloroflexi bacterium]|nr:DUF1624 domain-containing protein [Chloroflexota bacterium]
MTVITHYFSGMRASIRPIKHLKADRLWEIDTLRGVAIVNMVIYHFQLDLVMFGGYDIILFTGFWHYFQIFTACLFIGLVGVSLTLSYNQARQRGQQGVLWPRYLVRGFQVFSWGIVFSIITYGFMPSNYIRFGILNLIGFSIMIAYPFIRLRWINLFLGMFVLLLAELVPILRLNINWLDWFGLDATPHPGFDYFPVIGWFGVVLIGIFVGNTLYAGAERRYPLPNLANLRLIRLLRLLGQNSLLIYLIHQPILFVILTLLGLIRMW